MTATDLFARWLRHCRWLLRRRSRIWKRIKVLSWRKAEGRGGVIACAAPVETVLPNWARFLGCEIERPFFDTMRQEAGRVGGSVTRMEELDPIDLNYLAIYRATALDRVEIVKAGMKASVAKRIMADLDIPLVLASGALNVPISTINRKAKTGAVLRSDEGERFLGLAKLVGQVESMVQGVEGAKGFDARAWMSRWLREPVPALGGAVPLDYMDTMEGQALVSETLARAQSGAYG